VTIEAHTSPIIVLAHREGAQIACWQYARRKTVDRAASASKLGVIIWLRPYACIISGRMSSLTSSSTFLAAAGAGTTRCSGTGACGMRHGCVTPLATPVAFWIVVRFPSQRPPGLSQPSAGCSRHASSVWVKATHPTCRLARVAQQSPQQAAKDPWNPVFTEPRMVGASG
jgi:hypothetical protein